MKVTTLLMVLCVFMFSACSQSAPPAPVSAAAPAVSATAPVPIPAPIAKAEVPPVAPTIDPNLSPSKHESKLVAITTLSEQIVKINAELAERGNLSISQINAQGYPIFDITCDVDSKCVNSIGIPVGHLQDVASEMTTVNPDDVSKYGYHCEVVCRDAKGEVIGRLDHSGPAPATTL